MSHLLDQLLTAEQRAQAEAADARQARALSHYSAMARAAIQAKHGAVPAWVDPAHIVGGVEYAGAQWTIAAEPGEDAELYGLLINGTWLPAVDTLSEWALMGLQAALDAMPANEADDGPEVFDATRVTDLACVQYERTLDARASE